MVRQSWGGAEGSTCPLSVLVLGAAPASEEEACEAASRAEDLLRVHGYRARDFYGQWDARLIPKWRLLRRVDGEITRRLMQPQGVDPNSALWWLLAHLGPRFQAQSVKKSTRSCSRARASRMPSSARGPRNSPSKSR